VLWSVCLMLCLLFKLGIKTHLFTYILNRQYCANKIHQCLKVNVVSIVLNFWSTNFLLGIWSQHRRDNLWCIWRWTLSRGAGATAWTFTSSRNPSTSYIVPGDRAPCEIQVEN
jgi:hypothetical protein